MVKNSGPPLKNEEQEYVAALYERYHPELIRMARFLEYNREVAEDYVQETFLIAMDKLDTVRNCDDPGAYLTQILKNVIGYHIRSTKYAQELQRMLRAQQAVHREEERREELDPKDLYHGMVTEEELTLLLQFFHEGRSQKELAEDRGISVVALKKRIQRAKEHLRSALEGDK